MSVADGQEGADRDAGLAAALLVNGDLGGVGDLAVDDDLEHTHLRVRRVGGRVGVGGWRRGTVPGAAERRRAVELTAREAQIPWLAAGGLANPEIGTGLFLSACRVRYHLGKVFTKLGITSRAQLSRALSAS